MKEFIEDAANGLGRKGTAEDTGKGIQEGTEPRKEPTKETGKEPMEETANWD